MARFRPNSVARHETREQLSIPDSAVLVLFLGRLRRDKGVLDLANAIATNCERIRDVAVAYVGPDEEELRGEIEGIFGPWMDILRFVPFTENPEKFMAAADIFCLPSYREGFGSVVIEAAACGVPSVASRIYGLTDAVVDGETGILVEARDTGALAYAIEWLARDESERARMGNAARNRAIEIFKQERLTQAIVELYGGMLGSGVPGSDPVAGVGRA